MMSASDDGTVKVWDMDTFRQVQSVPIGSPLRSAAISPNGKWVVLGDRYGTVRVFDLSMDKLIVDFQQDTTINAVAFAPDSMSVASVGTDGSVVLWEIPQNQQQRKRVTLQGHTGPVYGVAFSPDGGQLATASWDGTVIVWDVKSGTPQRTIRGDEDGMTAVQFSPCGKMLATAGQDGRTRIWNADTGAMLTELGRHRGTVHTLRYSHDGNTLVTGGRDGIVRQWLVDCK